MRKVAQGLAQGRARSRKVAQGRAKRARSRKVAQGRARSRKTCEFAEGRARSRRVAQAMRIRRRSRKVFLEPRKDYALASPRGKPAVKERSRTTLYFTEVSVLLELV